MVLTNVVLIACGSFNPITNMHLRIFEVARDHLHRLGLYNVIGGLISPVHDAYGKKDLAAATHRISMVKLALQTSDWIKVSDWESKQESWSRTRYVLQYYQNQINAFYQQSKNSDQMNEEDYKWMPNMPQNMNVPIKVMLLCGADLLESFGTPGLWSDEDIESIVGEHGLVVITRINSNPLEFIYNSDVLTKYQSNIILVTEWITNEISSTKVRRALRRSESVKYLLPEKVIDYIYKNRLYGASKTKYLETPEYNSNFLTPQSENESPSPTNCMYICNNTLFAKNSIDTVDNNKLSSTTPSPSTVIHKTNLINSTGATRHPGQAVKVIMQDNGSHTIIDGSIGSNKKEVCNKKIDDQSTTTTATTISTSSNITPPPTTATTSLKYSKSCTNFVEDANNKIKSNLKECKSCDEQLIKFIFTKHGIQVISDVETIV